MLEWSHKEAVISDAMFFIDGLSQNSGHKPERGFDVLLSTIASGIETRRMARHCFLYAQQMFNIAQHPEFPIWLRPGNLQTLTLKISPCHRCCCRPSRARDMSAIRFPAMPWLLPVAVPRQRPLPLAAAPSWRARFARSGRRPARCPRSYEAARSTRPPPCATHCLTGREGQRRGEREFTLYEAARST